MFIHYYIGWNIQRPRVQVCPGILIVHWLSCTLTIAKCIILPYICTADAIQMFKKLLAILILLFPLTTLAQEEAVTSSGQTVLLFPDSTWKLKVQPSDSTYSDTDSLAIATPEPVKVKIYSDTLRGFKGFLRPELKLPTLPDQSEGIYEFRLKINKEGFVKEITTLKRGNGIAEQAMRNAIIKMKFTHNGQFVPPLTEGFIRIAIPPEK